MNPEIDNDVAIRWGELIRTLIEGFFDRLDDIEMKLTDMGCKIIKQKTISEDENSEDEDEDKDSLGNILNDRFISVLVPDEYYFDLIRIANKYSFFMDKVTDILMKERTVEYMLGELDSGFIWPSCNTVTYGKGSAKIELSAWTAASWMTLYGTESVSTLISGNLFLSKFGKSWGIEFDKTCLLGRDLNYGIGYHKSVKEHFNFHDYINEIKNSYYYDEGNGIYFMNPRTKKDLKINDDNIDGHEIYTSWIIPYFKENNDKERRLKTPIVMFGDPKYMFHGLRPGLEISIFDSIIKSDIRDRFHIRIRMRHAFSLFPDAFFRYMKGDI